MRKCITRPNLSWPKQYIVVHSKAVVLKITPAFSLRAGYRHRPFVIAIRRQQENLKLRTYNNNNVKTRASFHHSTSQIVIILRMNSANHIGIYYLPKKEMTLSTVQQFQLYSKKPTYDLISAVHNCATNYSESNFFFIPPDIFTSIFSLDQVM